MDPDSAAAHRLALARLYKNELREPDRAIDQLEEIVRAVPGHHEAVSELEAMLGDDALKERVVEILRPLYEDTDDWRRLIRLNEDRYALAETPAEKVLVLRETARLWEERGRDPQRARRAMKVAVGLDPDDSETARRVRASQRGHDDLGSAVRDVRRSAGFATRTCSASATSWRVWPRCTTSAVTIRAPRSTPTSVCDSSTSRISRFWRGWSSLATLLSDWPVLVNVLTSKAELRARRRGACEPVAPRRRSEARHARGPRRGHRGLRAGPRARRRQRVHRRLSDRAARALGRARHPGGALSAARRALR